MVVSAEIRWFWQGEAPAGLEEWFGRTGPHGCAAGGGKPRRDEYLLDPSQTELGIKRRGGHKTMEVKGLVAARWGEIAIGPFSGPIELWAKWTSPALDLPAARLLPVQKRRLLRAFDTAAPVAREVPQAGAEERRDKQPPPFLGCHVELTRLDLPNGAVWWTFGFEAFGNPRTVENDLCAVAVLLAARRPPELSGGLQASYPAWLAELPAKS